MLHVAYVMTGRAGCPKIGMSHQTVVRLNPSPAQSLRSYSGLIVDHATTWQKGKDV